MSQLTIERRVMFTHGVRARRARIARLFRFSAYAALAAKANKAKITLNTEGLLPYEKDDLMSLINCWIHKTKVRWVEAKP